MELLVISADLDPRGTGVTKPSLQLVGGLLLELRIPELVTHFLTLVTDLGAISFHASTLH